MERVSKSANNEIQDLFAYRVVENIFPILYLFTLIFIRKFTNTIFIRRLKGFFLLMMWISISVKMKIGDNLMTKLENYHT